jgi:NDP-sugar pyrophosphorylase family protein
MKAMVLAAGLGTRLAPLTHTVPKPLIPVNGHPLISYTLRYLKNYGISDIYINLHHLGDKIKAFLGDGSRFGLRIAYSEEPEILGTGGGIKKLEKELGDAPFLVINSDVLTDFNLSRLISFHHQNRGLATLVLREDPEVDRFGPVEIDSTGRIHQILGKGVKEGGVLKKRMFTGIHLVDPQVLGYLPEGIFHSITDTYIDILTQGSLLFGLEMKGFWADLGTLEEYGKINRLLTDGKINLPYL